MTRENNIKVWEKIYNQASEVMQYPDDILVRISHRLLNPQTHPLLLDYGFGSGSNMIHFINKGYQVAGVEVSESAIQNVYRRLNENQRQTELKLIQDNGLIPFENETFDVVLAWQVLYYNDWEHFNIALEEINRVLKPGGIFIGTMGAPGDFSHTHSVHLGDKVYRSNVPGQEGEIILILDEVDLHKYFVGKKVVIGQFGYQFGERHGRHWIIQYEK